MRSSIKGMQVSMNIGMYDSKEVRLWKCTLKKWILSKDSVVDHSDTPRGACRMAINLEVCKELKFAVGKEYA